MTPTLALLLLPALLSPQAATLKEPAAAPPASAAPNLPPPPAAQAVQAQAPQAPAPQAVPAPAIPAPAAPAKPASPPPAAPISLDAALAGLKGTGALSVSFELHSEGKSLGAVRCELWPDKAPQAVATFVGLVRGLVTWKDPHGGEWKKKPLYEGLLLHRVIADFLIQGGDPKCAGDIQCMFSPGSGDPGFAIPDEIRSDLRFDQPGLLALSNKGPNTGGSQFFITLRPTPWLSGHHTQFGLCDNLPLLQKVSQVETYPNDAPKTPIVIQKLTVNRKPK